MSHQVVDGRRADWRSNVDRQHLHASLRRPSARRHDLAAVGVELGHRCPRNCWIVNRSTGQPSGYTPGQMDPRFDRHSRLLTTGRELGQFVDDWENDRLSRLQ